MEWLGTLGVQSLLLFVTTVFVVNATPGADMLLTFTNTMRAGVRGGLATALGIGAGTLVHTGLVVLGVATLIVTSPSAYRALQWAGAAYLAWLAVGLLRAGLRGPDTTALSDSQISAALADVPAASRKPVVAAAELGTHKLFVQGLMTNVLNPKVALFFLALLPQFVSPGAAQPWQGLLFLGLWFAVQSFAFLAVFVRLVSVLRRWQPTPQRRRALHLLAAAALLLVALRLVIAQGLEA